MKRSLIRLLAVLCVVSLIMASFCACAKKDAGVVPQAGNETTPDASALRVGLLVERLGDNSLSDMLNNAVQKAKDKYGFQLDVSECGSGDMSMTLQDYTQSQEYDLIIMLYHALDVAIEMQEEYPQQKYLVYDVACEGQPNITSLSYAKNEMGFMSGVFTALMDEKGEATVNGETKTWIPSNRFGSLIGVNLPSTVGAVTGYAAGVRYIAPNADVQLAEIGSWADQASAKELALTMYNSGINFIFHNAGGSALGALEAAKTAERFMVGFDANQNNLDATHILASSHKNHDDVIDRFFADFVAGTFHGGENVVNSYANVGLKFTYQEGLEVPDDIAAVMEAVKANLASGELVPPSSEEELAGWNQTLS